MPRRMTPSAVADRRRRPAGEHLADLQPAARANDHPAAARIAHRVDRRKAADLAHGSDADEMMARHGGEWMLDSGCWI